MLFSLYDGRQELAQYAQNTHIANDDNAWFHQWINRGWRGRHNNHPTLSSEQSTGNTEGELEAYRKLTYLPEQVAGVYGQLLSQELYGSTRAEFKFGYNGHGYAWGYINNRNQKHFASKLYFSQDAQNSTIKVAGENNEHSYRYAYTPFGQAYGFSDRRTNQWRNEFYAKDYLNAHVVPYLYTGKYTDPVTGLANMDARWYDAKTGRFVQTDQYNHANLMLPKGAQSELMRYIGRSQSNLLRDPAQQMRYGYVSGNVLTWTDPLGLDGEVCKAPLLTPEQRQEFLALNNVSPADISAFQDYVETLAKSDGGYQIIRSNTPAYEGKSDMGIYIAEFTGTNYLDPKRY